MVLRLFSSTGRFSLSLTCTIAETGTKEAYNRDPRGIAQRGEKYLASTGLADTAVFGPEAEFFIFDNVQFDSKSNGFLHEKMVHIRTQPVCVGNVVVRTCSHQQLVGTVWLTLIQRFWCPAG